MVDVKIDLSKKTEAEVMALMTDLTHYTHILSADREIGEFRKEIGYAERSEYNSDYVIKEINNCIVKYCEGDYITSIKELRDGYEGLE